MVKFEFDFDFQHLHYTGECQQIQLDGTSELRVTPLDSELFEIYGIHTLLLMADGSIKAAISSQKERKYITAVALGLSNYFTSQRTKNN